MYSPTEEIIVESLRGTVKILAVEFPGKTISVAVSASRHHSMSETGVSWAGYVGHTDAVAPTLELLLGHLRATPPDSHVVAEIAKLRAKADELERSLK